MNCSLLLTIDSLINLLLGVCVFHVKLPPLGAQRRGAASPDISPTCVGPGLSRSLTLVGRLWRVPSGEIDVRCVVTAVGDGRRCSKPVFRARYKIPPTLTAPVSGSIPG